MGTTKVSISNSQNHTEEMALAQSVFQKRGPGSQEYDGAGQENLETMQIESIELRRESKQEVVEHRANSGSCNPI